MYQFPEVQNASKGIKNGERNATARQEKKLLFFTSAEHIAPVLCTPILIGRTRTLQDEEEEKPRTFCLVQSLDL